MTNESFCIIKESFHTTLYKNPMAEPTATTRQRIMAAVFFKEKINLRCIIGVVLAFVGILVINL